MPKSARVSLSTLEGSEEDVRKLLGIQSTSQVTNVNLRNQAISLKFRLLSIRFTSEAFVGNRKMSEIESRVENRRINGSLPVGA